MRQNSILLGSILCCSMLFQQTGAYSWILQGSPSPRFSVIAHQPSFAGLLLDWFHGTKEAPVGSQQDDEGFEAFPGGGGLSWQASDFVGQSGLSVNLANGNLHGAWPVVNWKNGLSFSIYYNSLGRTVSSSIAPQFSHSYSERLIFEGPKSVILLSSDGVQVPFTLEDGRGENRYFRLSLHREGDSWVLSSAQENLMIFNSLGVLQALVDNSGNQTDLQYDTQTGLLRSVRDPLGRSLSLNYEPGGLGRLVSVQAPPLGQTLRVFRISYDPDGKPVELMSARRNSSGQPMYSRKFGYDAFGRLNSASDYGSRSDLGQSDPWNEYRVLYETSDLKARVTATNFPETFDFVENHSVSLFRRYEYQTISTGLWTTVTDFRGGMTRYEFDRHGRLTRLVDPLGRVVSRIEYGMGNRVRQSVNLLGDVSEMDYDARGNLTRLQNSRGEIIHRYDERNRCVETTDAMGNSMALDYGGEQDPNPFKPKRAFDPARPANQVALSWSQGDSEANFAANFRGLPLRSEDPNGVSMGFSYDNYGNMTGLDYGHVPQPGADRGAQGVGPDRYCGNDERRLDSHPTGENIAAREVPQCPLFDPNSDPEPSPDGDCSSQVATACGSSAGSICASSYDAEGNRYLDCQGCGMFVELGGSVAPSDDFEYDGNGRLLMARDNRDRAVLPNGCLDWDQDQRIEHTVEYRYTYDSFGRMTLMQSFAPDGSSSTFAACQFGQGGPGPEGWVCLQPTVFRHTANSTEFRFSDLHGKSRQIYRRFNTGFLNRPPITIETKADLAGRTLSITRTEGNQSRSTNYEYNDSSVLPAIMERRPDGSQVKTWVARDGLTSRICYVAPQGHVLADYRIDRNALGKIVRVDEERFDPRAADGYLSAVLSFEYGSGNLSLKDLDPDCGDPQWRGGKLEGKYYRFLAELGGGWALEPGSPNQLVRERRVYANSLEARIAGDGYDTQYWYDPGGNRLVKETSDPGTRGLRSQTRYNYAAISQFVVNEGASLFFGCGGESVTVRMPGTPAIWTNGGQENNYDREGATLGRNRLWSTQTISFDNAKDGANGHQVQEPSPRVSLTIFGYGGSLGSANAITSRTEKSFSYDPASWGIPWRLDNPNYLTSYYSYKNERLEMVEQRRGQGLHLQSREYSHFDMFGRLDMTSHFEVDTCDGSQEALSSILRRETRFLDYYGMGSSVIATRKGSLLWNGNLDSPGFEYVGDRFESSFSPGLFGPNAVTQEKGNTEISDNQVFYYVTDPFGNHVAAYPEGTDRAAFQSFDAFGNRLNVSTIASGAYAWRGLEGSETNRSSELIHMQAREYDPQLGRFLSADSLPYSGSGTLGLNRYIYCANDPVNASDPDGRNPIALAIAMPALVGALVYALAIVVILYALFQIVSLLLLFLAELIRVLSDTIDACFVKGSDGAFSPRQTGNDGPNTDPFNPDPYIDPEDPFTKMLKDMYFRYFDRGPQGTRTNAINRFMDWLRNIKYSN